MSVESESVRATAQLVEGVAAWYRRRAVRLCVLFGSRARGGARRESDLDVALWVDSPPPAAHLLVWRRELTRDAGVPVQLVLVTPSLDPVLGFEIARDGEPLYQADPGSWSQERMRLWHAYQDALPFLRASRRRLGEFVARVRRGA
ncbi:MAG TPA: nucleotidyltransferase domain-containing protein [Thermoanaerobaculia bacterium]|nr:nucleotidyltransferase domain-containing protein [Thermoanaerobaculia bacterium]